MMFMRDIKNVPYEELCNELRGKTVRFVSDCELFHGFDVTGRVQRLDRSQYETLIYVKTTSGKLLTIGSNMDKLRYQIKD